MNVPLRQIILHSEEEKYSEVVFGGLWCIKRIVEWHKGYTSKSKE